MNTSTKLLLAATSVALLGAAALAQERATPKLRFTGAAVATAPTPKATPEIPISITTYGPRCSANFGALEGRFIYGDVFPVELEVTYGPTSLVGIPCVLAIGSEAIDVPLPGGCRLLNNALILVPFLSDITGYKTWRTPLPMTIPFELYIQCAEEIGPGFVETSNGLLVKVI